MARTRAAVREAPAAAGTRADVLSSGILCFLKAREGSQEEPRQPCTTKPLQEGHSSGHCALRTQEAQRERHGHHHKLAHSSFPSLPSIYFFFPPPPPSNCSIMTRISNTIGGAAAEEQHSLLKCEDQASILFTSLFWNHLGTGTMQCHSAEPVSTAPEPAALGAKYFPTSEKGLFPFHVRSCQS